MSKGYTKEFKLTILDLYNQGKSDRHLSLEQDVSYSTVLKWIQETTRISPVGFIPDEAKLLRKQLKEKDEEIPILKKRSAVEKKKP